MKKYLMMVLSVLIAIQAMTFGAFAAETKTELYNEDFNDFNTSKVQDVGVRATDKTTTITKTIAKDAANDSDQKLALQQAESSANPAGRLDFTNVAEVKSSGKSQIVEAEFDAQVINCDGVKPSTSKTLTSDYLLCAPEASAAAGFLGGIRFEVKVTSTEYGETMPDWGIKFVAADNTTSSTLKKLTNANMKEGMTHFKIQYVFRENGETLNVARMWINGDPVGGDLPLKTGSELTKVGGMLIKPSGKDKAPKAVIDNLVVSEIFDDGGGEEEPDPTPTPDPVYPVPEGDDAVPDVDLKTGTLAAFNFDKFDKVNDDALPIGWTTSKQAKYIVSTDGKNGRAFRLKGTASTETNLKTVFAPTGLNKDTAPLEGKNARVVTEFDIRLNNIQSKESNSTQTVDIQFGKDENDIGGTSNTPGIQITFDGDTFAYKTNGTNSAAISYTPAQWLHFKITHLVTDVHGIASKNFTLEIDGKEIVNSTKLSSATDSKIAMYNQFLIRMKNAGADASIDIDNFIVEKFNLENLQVSDPMFYQGDTNDVMNDLNNADVLRTKVEFTVGEDEPETENAVVIVALYEGNTDKYTLVQAATGIAALRQGEKTIAEVKLDLSGFTSTQRDNMFVNIMVWDGLGSMQPLVPCKSMQ